MANFVTDTQGLAKGGKVKVLFWKISIPHYMPNLPNPRAFSAFQKDHRVILGLFFGYSRLFLVRIGHAASPHYRSLQRSPRVIARIETEV